MVIQRVELEEGQMEEPDRPTPRKCGGWYAWRDHEPSGPAALKVTGELRVSHSRLSRQSCDLPLHGRRRSHCTPNHARFLAALKGGVARKERRQFVSDLCLTHSTNHQQSIADSSRSLRCTHTLYIQTGGIAEQVRKRGSRRAQEGSKTGDVRH